MICGIVLDATGKLSGAEKFVDNADTCPLTTSRVNMPWNSFGNEPQYYVVVNISIYLPSDGIEMVSKWYRNISIYLPSDGIEISHGY